MPTSGFHESFANALKHASVDATSLLKLADNSVANEQLRRFDIYRNNRAVSLIEALSGTYPAIRQLVGEDFFKASAKAFIDMHPPTQPVMSEYGQEFGHFMLSLPNTGKLPFLSDLAKLEWYRLQAYHSADAPALNPSALAAIEPNSLMDLRLQCHPTLHCIVSEWPIGSIWAICTEGSGTNPGAHSKVDMQKGEAIVITRPIMDVMTNIIDQSAATFLLALQCGETLGNSAELALERDSEFNAGEHLTGLMMLGAFSRIIEN